MKRRGLGIGRGMGYRNIAPMDSYVHSLSAKGVKTIPLTRVSYGKKDTPKDKREYRYGNSPVGTITEWKKFAKENAIKRLEFLDTFDSFVVDIDAKGKDIDYSDLSISSMSKSVEKDSGFKFTDVEEVTYTQDGKTYKRKDVSFDGVNLDSLGEGEYDEYYDDFKKLIISPLKEKGLPIDDWGYAEKGMWIIYLKEKVIS